MVCPCESFTCALVEVPRLLNAERTVRLPEIGPFSLPDLLGSVERCSDWLVVSMRCDDVVELVANRFLDASEKITLKFPSGTILGKLALFPGFNSMLESVENIPQHAICVL